MSENVNFELDTIVCGDCLDVIRDMPDGCVDLSVVDPPFNLGFDYGPDSDDKKPLDEYRQWLKTIMNEVERITREGRLIFLWQAMPHCLPVWNDYPQARLMAGCKDFVQLRKVDVQWAFDPILFWNKEGTQYHFSDNGVQGPRRDWHLAKTSRWVLEAKGFWHPCPRPLDTVEYIVNQWSKEGDLIFDPFIGSGTTAVAALKLGRHFYGCDINPEYVKLANERIEKTRLEMSQMELAL
jgi:DNA modification methylase